MHEKIQNNQEEQAVRVRLLDAAVGLFAQNGYAGTSVREIVERAGVTKPVLYYYFKSKAGLFLALMDEASDWQEVLISEVFNAPGTARERLIWLYRRIYDAFQENPEFFKFIHALIFGPPQGTPSYDLEKFRLQMSDAVKAIYLEGLENGEFIEANSEDVLFLIMGVNDFCLHMDYMFPEQSDPERPERLLRMAFQGLNKTYGSDHEGQKR